MVKNFDEVQQFGKGGVEATMKSFGAFSKSVQAIATEAADYSKKAFEDGTAAAEKLMGAKTLDKAVEVQSDYFKKAYEAFVSQATKVSELYADLAKETYKPFEGYVARAGVK
jgi:phasin family protein